MEVIVADDGTGFDPDAVERSFGLVGMEERATLSGGSLEIESAPGRGTQVRAELPSIAAEAGGRIRPTRALSDSSRA